MVLGACDRLFCSSAIVCVRYETFLSAAINSAFVLVRSSISLLLVAVRLATACLSLEVAMARFARASAVSCWCVCS